MAAAKSDLTEIVIAIAELRIQSAHLTTIVEIFRETMDGTIKTRGLKSQIAIAQMHIEANKQAYLDVMVEVRKVEERIGRSLVESTAALSRLIDTKFAELKQADDSMKSENAVNKTFREMAQPVINVIAWAVAIAGAILIGMILNGRIHITP